MRDTITNITLNLNCLVAEPPDAQSATLLHLVSVFGGDQDVGAVIAAAQEALRFRIAFGAQEFIGTLGEKPVIYKASLQIPGRKRPVRHTVLLSRALFETTLGANNEARRTVLFDDTPDFVLHRLAVRFGLPVLPDSFSFFERTPTQVGSVHPEYVECNKEQLAAPKHQVFKLWMTKFVKRHNFAIENPVFAFEFRR